jgi:hypothetical protein
VEGGVDTNKYQRPTVSPRPFFACMHPVKIYVELISSQSAFYLK